MTKKQKGGWRTINERRYMRMRFDGSRLTIPLSGVKTDEEADARCAMIAEAVESLLAAGHAKRVDEIARKLGAAATPKAAALIQKATARIVEDARVLPKGITFGQWAERWTSGELARLYPDHVKPRAYRDERSRLVHHILPYVKDTPIAAFALEDAEYIMSKLPAGASSSLRRHVAQVIARLFRLAVYPGKLIDASPIPPGFLPKTRKGAAKTYLYPEEDAQLLACTKIPLARRIAYGLLAREGMRSGELLGCDKDKAKLPMAWRNVDLKLGSIRLDINKTEDPRTWAADPAVARALKAWWELCGEPGGETPIVDLFPRLGILFRLDLKRAGVTRPELFERSSARRPIRVHDLRATFVTLSLAAGKSEMWVADRTGHSSSEMIARYRRAARTAAELHLGNLAPMDEAIPELRAGATVGQNSDQTAESPEGEQ